MSFFVFVTSLMPFVSLSQQIIDKWFFARDNLYYYTLDRALENENNVSVRRFGWRGTPAKQIFYPNNGNSKWFIPLGTFLFECNYKVGCCPIPKAIPIWCEPIKQETIKVAFIVDSLKRATLHALQALQMSQVLQVFHNSSKCRITPNVGQKEELILIIIFLIIFIVMIMKYIMISIRFYDLSINLWLIFLWRDIVLFFTLLRKGFFKVKIEVNSYFLINGNIFLRKFVSIFIALSI